MILLDEPTAGMSHSETDHAVALIRWMTEGKTLVMVEHDMSVVFGLADVISVLVYGEVIACDRPEEIRANRAVQEAYLGDGGARDAGSPRPARLLRQEPYPAGRRPRVGEGEIVSLLGRNGVGRSTTCKAIMGLVAPQGADHLQGAETSPACAPT